MDETTDSIRRDIDRERNQLEQNIDGIEARVRDTTEQVQHKVEGVQHQVQDKVEEVQHKIKDAADWRAQFDRRPMVGLAVAFGGGALLASMMGGSNDRNRQSYSGGYQPQFQSYRDGGQGGFDVGRQHVSSTFDNVKGALMGVAAAQLKNMLSQSLPGFDDEYRQVETETGSRQAVSQRQSHTANSSSQSQSGYPGGTSERRQEI